MASACGATTDAARGRLAQAAATLAATFVGPEIGLLDTSAVNAVMLLIVVSLIASSAAASFFGARIPRPAPEAGRLGRSVLVHVVADRDAVPTVRLAARLAEADGGVVRPVVVVGKGLDPPGEHELEAVEHAVAGLGIDAEIEVRHDRSALDGVVNAASSHSSSLVLAPVEDEAWLPALTGTWNALAASSPVPVGFVRAGTGTPRRVVLVLAQHHASRPRPAAGLAVQVTARLRRSGLEVLVVSEAEPADGLVEPLGDAQLLVTPVLTWLAAERHDADVVVLAGGRNGALGASSPLTLAVGAT